MRLFSIFYEKKLKKLKKMQGLSLYDRPPLVESRKIMKRAWFIRTGFVLYNPRRSHGIQDDYPADVVWFQSAKKR